jgi:hypothetical protein
MSTACNNLRLQGLRRRVRTMWNHRQCLQVRLDGRWARLTPCTLVFRSPGACLLARSNVRQGHVPGKRGYQRDAVTPGTGAASSHRRSLRVLRGRERWRV